MAVYSNTPGQTKSEEIYTLQNSMSQKTLTKSLRGTFNFMARDGTEDGQSLQKAIKIGVC